MNREEKRCSIEWQVSFHPNERKAAREGPRICSVVGLEPCSYRQKWRKR